MNVGDALEHGFVVLNATPEQRVVPHVGSERKRSQAEVVAGNYQAVRGGVTLQAGSPEGLLEAVASYVADQGRLGDA